MRPPRRPLGRSIRRPTPTGSRLTIVKGFRDRRLRPLGHPPELRVRHGGGRAGAATPSVRLFDSPSPAHGQDEDSDKHTGYRDGDPQRHVLVVAVQLRMRAGFPGALEVRGTDADSRIPEEGDRYPDRDAGESDHSAANGSRPH